MFVCFFTCVSVCLGLAGGSVPSPIPYSYSSMMRPEDISCGETQEVRYFLCASNTQLMKFIWVYGIFLLETWIHSDNTLLSLSVGFCVVLLLVIRIISLSFRLGGTGNVLLVFSSTHHLTHTHISNLYPIWYKSIVYWHVQDVEMMLLIVT